MTQAAFSASVAVVLREEGGYVNDPNDPGGETKYGISKRSYPDLDIKNLTVEQATDIYRRDFWVANKFYNWPVGAFALMAFDASVNMGYDEAAKITQRALGVKDDGVIGPLTVAKMVTVPRKLTLARMADERNIAYAKIAVYKILSQKPHQALYIAEWEGRTKRVREDAWALL